MAMSVIDPFVAPIVLSTKSDWDNMINFKQITVTKGESTSWALPLLYLKELCFFVIHEWMLFEPFNPVKQVAIIWAGVSLDEDILLMLCVYVAHNIHGFGLPFFIFEEGSKSLSFINSDDVPFFYPLFAFLWMPS